MNIITNINLFKTDLESLQKNLVQRHPNDFKAQYNQIKSKTRETLPEYSEEAFKNNEDLKEILVKIVKLICINSAEIEKKLTNLYEKADNKTKIKINHVLNDLQRKKKEIKSHDQTYTNNQIWQKISEICSSIYSENIENHYQQILRNMTYLLYQIMEINSNFDFDRDYPTLNYLYNEYFYHAFRCTIGNVETQISIIRSLDKPKSFLEHLSVFRSILIEEVADDIYAFMLAKTKLNNPNNIEKIQNLLHIYSIHITQKIFSLGKDYLPFKHQEIVNIVKSSPLDIDGLHEAAAGLLTKKNESININKSPEKIIEHLIYYKFKDKYSIDNFFKIQLDKILSMIPKNALSYDDGLNIDFSNIDNAINYKDLINNIENILKDLELISGTDSKRYISTKEIELDDNIKSLLNINLDNIFIDILRKSEELELTTSSPQSIITPSGEYKIYQLPNKVLIIKNDKILSDIDEIRAVMILLQAKNIMSISCIELLDGTITSYNLGSLVFDKINKLMKTDTISDKDLENLKYLSLHQFHWSKIPTLIQFKNETTQQQFKNELLTTFLDVFSSDLRFDLKFDLDLIRISNVCNEIFSQNLDDYSENNPFHFNQQNFNNSIILCVKYFEQILIDINDKFMEFHSENYILYNFDEILKFVEDRAKDIQKALESNPNAHKYIVDNYYSYLITLHNSCINLGISTIGFDINPQAFPNDTYKEYLDNLFTIPFEKAYYNSIDKFAKIITSGDINHCIKQIFSSSDSSMHKYISALLLSDNFHAIQHIEKNTIFSILDDIIINFPEYELLPDNKIYKKMCQYIKDHHDSQISKFINDFEQNDEIIYYEINNVFFLLNELKLSLNHDDNYKNIFSNKYLKHIRRYEDEYNDEKEARNSILLAMISNIYHDIPLFEINEFMNIVAYDLNQSAINHTFDYTGLVKGLDETNQGIIDNMKKQDIYTLNILALKEGYRIFNFQHANDDIKEHAQAYFNKYISLSYSRELLEFEWKVSNISYLEYVCKKLKFFNDKYTKEYENEIATSSENLLSLNFEQLSSENEILETLKKCNNLISLDNVLYILVINEKLILDHDSFIQIFNATSKKGHMIRLLNEYIIKNTKEVNQEIEIDKVLKFICSKNLINNTPKEVFLNITHTILQLIVTQNNLIQSDNLKETVGIVIKNIGDKMNSGENDYKSIFLVQKIIFTLLKIDILNKDITQRKYSLINYSEVINNCIEDINISSIIDKIIKCINNFCSLSSNIEKHHILNYLSKINIMNITSQRKFKDIFRIGQDEKKCSDMFDLIVALEEADCILYRQISEVKNNSVICNIYSKLQIAVQEIKSTLQNILQQIFTLNLIQTNRPNLCLLSTIYNNHISLITGKDTIDFHIHDIYKIYSYFYLQIKSYFIYTSTACIDSNPSLIFTHKVMNFKSRAQRFIQPEIFNKQLNNLISYGLKYLLKNDKFDREYIPNLLEAVSVIKLHQLIKELNIDYIKTVFSDEILEKINKILELMSNQDSEFDKNISAIINLLLKKSMNIHCELNIDSRNLTQESNEYLINNIFPIFADNIDIENLNISTNSSLTYKLKP